MFVSIIARLHPCDIPNTWRLWFVRPDGEEVALDAGAYGEQPCHAIADSYALPLTFAADAVTTES